MVGITDDSNSSSHRGTGSAIMNCRIVHPRARISQRAGMSLAHHTLRIARRPRGLVFWRGGTVHGGSL